MQPETQETHVQPNHNHYQKRVSSINSSKLLLPLALAMQLTAAESLWDWGGGDRSEHWCWQIYALWFRPLLCLPLLFLVVIMWLTMLMYFITSQYMTTDVELLHQFTIYNVTSSPNSFSASYLTHLSLFLCLLSTCLYCVCPWGTWGGHSSHSQLRRVLHFVCVHLKVTWASP